MSAKEKEAAAKQTFTFPAPLTNESPCEAGRGARQRGFVSARMKKAEKRAVLAQSSFRRLLLIGRKPDRAGKCNFSAHARRAQRKRIAMRSRARSATARIRECDSEVNRPTEQGKTARKWS